MQDAYEVNPIHCSFACFFDVFSALKFKVFFCGFPDPDA